MKFRVIPIAVGVRSELIPPIDTDEKRRRMLLDVSDELEQSSEMLEAIVSSETRDLFVGICDARHSRRHQVAHCTKKRSEW